MSDSKIATASKAPNLNEDISSDSEFVKELEAMLETDAGSQQTPAPEKSGKDSERGDEDIETLKKRYSDSSREAKRLREELESLQQYKPVLDAIENDPALVDHIKNYYAGGGQASASIKDRLGLPEDFVYDADEAMSDPNSDSAKLLKATMGEMVSSEVQKVVKTQTAAERRKAEEDAFKKEHDMTDEEFNDFISWAKKTPMTLENMYILKNLQSRDKKIASQAMQDIQKQMENVRRTPPSLSTAGSEEKKQSPEAELFSAMLKLDRQKNSIFE